MINPPEFLVALPGADLVIEGLSDHHHGRLTIASCLVRIASPRLIRAGLLDSIDPSLPDAEIELYQLLSLEGNNAHGRYNSLIRQLVSFEHALDHHLPMNASSSISYFHEVDVVS